MMNKGTERDGVRMTEIERERKRGDKRGSKDKRKIQRGRERERLVEIRKILTQNNRQTEEKKGNKNQNPL